MCPYSLLPMLSNTSCPFLISRPPHIPQDHELEKKHAGTLRSVVPPGDTGPFGQAVQEFGSDRPAKREGSRMSPLVV